MILPAISLNYYVDGEYVLTAHDRVSGSILAAASSYDVDVATLRIDIQLIELGIDIYSDTFEDLVDSLTD